MSVGAAGMPGYLACRWARGSTGLTVSREIEPANVGAFYVWERMMPRADRVTELPNGASGRAGPTRPALRTAHGRHRDRRLAGVPSGGVGPSPRTRAT